jgi:hypothetical protein
VARIDRMHHAEDVASDLRTKSFEVGGIGHERRGNGFVQK